MSKVPSMRMITGSAININETGSGGLRKAESAAVANQISLLLDDSDALLIKSVLRSAKMISGV